MSRGNERIVIKGNEFYEIDLECEKRKLEGKVCGKEERKRRDTKDTRYKKI